MDWPNQVSFRILFCFFFSEPHHCSAIRVIRMIIFGLDFLFTLSKNSIAKVAAYDLDIINIHCGTWLGAQSRYQYTLDKKTIFFFSSSYIILVIIWPDVCAQRTPHSHNATNETQWCLTTATVCSLCLSWRIDAITNGITQFYVFIFFGILFGCAPRFYSSQQKTLVVRLFRLEWIVGIKRS